MERTWHGSLRDDLKARRMCKFLLQLARIAARVKQEKTSDP
jgi:hypothetical protein